MLLTSTHCGKQKPAVPLIAGITTAATPLPLEEATMTRQATQSSEMPLMEILAIPFREKTLTMTQNLTPIPGGNRLIPSAAPRYLALLRPQDRPRIAAGQRLSPWTHPGAPAVPDLGLADTAARNAAPPLTTRGPPTAHGAPRLHLTFRCGGTPPPRAPWSRRNRASRRWGPQDGTGRSMPCWPTCRR